MVRQFIDRQFIKRPRLRKLITSIIYGRNDAKVVLAGVGLTVNRLRENGYLRAFYKAKGSSFLEHELGIIVTLIHMVGFVDVFIDVGANIGIFSCFMARHKMFFPEFRVVAFEPHPDTFGRLQANATKYGIEAHNIALSDDDAIVEFVDGAVSHVFTCKDHASKYNIESDVTPIRTMRLDEFNFENRALMIKIDVEGHEMAVLRGAQGLFSENLVKVVYVDGYDDSDVPLFLINNGFTLYDARNMEESYGNIFALLALHNDIQDAVIDLRNSNNANDEHST